MIPQDDRREWFPDLVVLAAPNAMLYNQDMLYSAGRSSSHRLWGISVPDGISL